MDEIDQKTGGCGQRSAAKGEFTAGGQTGQKGNGFPTAGHGRGESQSDQGAGKDRFRPVKHGQLALGDRLFLVVFISQRRLRGEEAYDL